MSSAWQILQFPFNLFGSPPSKIPQFILDADHPWINENRPWLEQYPGVQHALDHHNSTLWTNPAPSRAVPADLFRRLVIDNSKAGVSRHGWANAVARLREMKDCLAALHDVEHLYVDIYVHDGPYSTLQEASEPPAELPPLFADVLASMPRLAKLEWGIKADQTRVFEKAFGQRNLTLPSVQHLIPGAFSDYMVRMCPNLEVLEGGSYFNHWSWNEYLPDMPDPRLLLVRSAATAKNITEFVMSAGSGEWYTELLEEALKSMPNLTSLGMEGDLSRSSRYRALVEEHDGDQVGKLLKEYLNIIARFPKLEHLRLPRSSELSLGFDGGSFCGNAYFGEGGRSYGRSVVKQRVEATELAAGIVTAELPHLKGLTIGSTCVNLTRSEDGDLETSWPWTGRLDEYAYEIYPL